MFSCLDLCPPLACAISSCKILLTLSAAEVDVEAVASVLVLPAPLFLFFLFAAGELFSSWMLTTERGRAEGGTGVLFLFS